MLFILPQDHADFLRSIWQLFLTGDQTARWKPLEVCTSIGVILFVYSIRTVLKELGFLAVCDKFQYYEGGVYSKLKYVQCSQWPKDMNT